MTVAPSLRSRTTSLSFAYTREGKSNMPSKGPCSHPTMENVHVQSNSFHERLSDLKTHNATGPDSIHAYVLKSGADQLAPILTRLYKYSLDFGEIPLDWKNAFVVPIFKKREKHVPSNYRPVSLRKPIKSLNTLSTVQKCDILTKTRF